MKRWRWALLIFELFLFALILVLPQVALPDFTFHGGTAPVVAKNRVSASPVLLTHVVSVQRMPLLPLQEAARDTEHPVPSSTPRCVLSLHCTLIC
jgi:hypothetical protein